jgi:hypothetical protein
VTPTITPTLTPTPQGLGETCETASECETGFCANGVCCNRACNLAGQVCDRPDSLGTCIDVANVPAASNSGIVMLVLILGMAGGVLVLMRRRA